MANIHIAKAIQAERLRTASRITAHDADAPTRRRPERTRRSRHWRWLVKPVRPCPTC